MVILHVCVGQADIEKYLIRSERPWTKLSQIQAGLGNTSPQPTPDMVEGVRRPEL